MGLFSKKSKQTSTPWKQAQPYILNGMNQTQATFDQNQPRLQEMSGTAYDAFKQVAPNAFGASPLLSNAQNASQRFASGEMAGRDPSNSFLSGLLSSRPTNAAFAGAKSIADGSYLDGNRYLDDVIGASIEDANDAANGQFSMAGRYGSGAHAGVLAKNAGRISSGLRNQAYEADRGRQMQALGLLGQLDEQAQGRQMQAAGLLSQNHDADQARQMQAIGMAPQLRLAEFAGVQPALGLLSSAASIPYAGVDALTGNIRQASSGYGTQSSAPGMFEWLQMFGQNASRAAGGGF